MVSGSDPNLANHAERDCWWTRATRPGCGSLSVAMAPCSKRSTPSASAQSARQRGAAVSSQRPLRSRLRDHGDRRVRAALDRPGPTQARQLTVNER
jgi:hypothetical protein